MPNLDALTVVHQSLSADNFLVESKVQEILRTLPRQRLSKQALSSGKIQSGSLVEYRGMVQDMFDPELFCVSYIDGKTHEKHSGLFRDTFPSGWNAQSEQLGEREVVYLVPVPGETPWMQSLIDPSSSVQPITDEEKPMFSGKREREVDENQMDVQESEPNKRSRNDRVDEKESKPTIHLTENFPLAASDLPCMIKLYDETIVKYPARRFQLHDVVRVVGILSLDYLEDADAEKLAMNGSIETRDCLPASVAPRVHVLNIQVEDSLLPLYPSLAVSIEEARMECLKKLHWALHGDALASEFVLLWLMSKSSKDSTVGKMSLGLTKVNCDMNQLRLVFESLLPRFQSASLDDLDKGAFLPRKDMEMNRLLAGRLQVAPGTRFVFDETNLAPRQLSAVQVKNVQAMNRLAEQQTIEYDFGFFTREQHVDEPVLVLTSNSKPCIVSSMDCIVPLSVPLISSTPLFEVPPSSWECLRVYLETCRSLSSEVDVGEDVCKQAEKDFVDGRQGVKPSVTEQDLHLWLNLTRFISASFGSRVATLEHYTRAKVLEEERKRRLVL